MKIKEITLSASKKLPIDHQAFTNKESAFSMTVEIEEGEDISKLWQMVKQQVEIGLQEVS